MMKRLTLPQKMSAWLCILSPSVIRALLLTVVAVASTISNTAADAAVVEKNIYVFQVGGADGPSWSGMTWGVDGKLYGAADGFFQVDPVTGVYLPITSYFPVDSYLALGPDGNFYGTGGTAGSYGDGAITKITPGGTSSTLFTFENEQTGYWPWGGVVFGNDGYLYGVTSGNQDTATAVEEYGTFYKVAANGSSFTTLHVFQPGLGTDAERAPVLASDGNFYGGTRAGSSATSNECQTDYICGVLYRITPTGTYTVLHQFQGSADGGSVDAPLIVASDGNLYGQTVTGGAYQAGSIFKMSLNGSFTLLHSFSVDMGGDGEDPMGPLTEGSDGRLYGATCAGGSSNSNGEIFRISKSGFYEPVFIFDGYNSGGCPNGYLVFDTAGNIFGTNRDLLDGLYSYGPGLIFELSNVLEATSAALSYTPGSLQFGNVQVGAAPTLSITLTDTGDLPFDLAHVSISSPTAVSFYTDGLCYATDESVGQEFVAPHSSCNLNVQAFPSTVGVTSATLTISTSNLVGPTIALSATGVAPQLTFSPTSITVSPTKIGSTSTPVSVTITNVGTANLSPVTVKSSTAGLVQTNNCGTVISVGQQCSMNVTYTPTQRIEPRSPISASISINNFTVPVVVK